MSDKYRIYVITGDTDHNENIPLQGVEPNSWIDFSTNIQVMYLNKSNQNMSNIGDLVKSINPDFLYLNSMFSKVFTIYPLLVNRKLGKKVVLSPRGMLKSSALQFKPVKKKIFLFLLKRLNILSNTEFHATDFQEKEDIKQQLGIPEERIVEVGNYPKSDIPVFHEYQKNLGEVKLIFISRVLEIKNLLHLLRAMKGLKNIQLDIYGPKDEEYWKKCSQVIGDLDSTNVVNYLGSIPNEEVSKKIQNAHFFVLPTLGENFGHAIFEAFAAGRPVIISDQTPWKELTNKNIGWDLPLSDVNLWQETLNNVIRMDNITFQKKCKDSYTFARDYIANSGLKHKYLELFS